MQSAEIELKFPVPDPRLPVPPPRPRLSLDTPRTFEHNTLYDTPARDLRAAAQILRIRQYGALWTVTHKRTRPRRPVDTTRYKVRIETETAS